MTFLNALLPPLLSFLVCRASLHYSAAVKLFSVFLWHSRFFPLYIKIVRFVGAFDKNSESFFFFDDICAKIAVWYTPFRLFRCPCLSASTNVLSSLLKESRCGIRRFVLSTWLDCVDESFLISYGDDIESSGSLSNSTRYAVKYLLRVGRRRGSWVLFMTTSRIREREVPFTQTKDRRSLCLAL